VRSGKRGAIIIIIFLAALLVLAVLLVRSNVGGGSSAVALPEVSAQMTAEDGSSHVVHAEFTLLGKKLGKLGAEEKRVLSELIEQNMTSEMSYEAITAEDGAEYLKNQVKPLVSSELGNVEVEVYITSLQNDFNTPNKPSSKYDRVEKFFGK
jgi:flagellar basal body-associated protein FliL